MKTGSPVRSFDELWIELGRTVLEKNIGEVSENHRKKTLFVPVMGK